jgi:hypothetical protein
MITTPVATYTKLLLQYRKQQAQLMAKRSRLGWARLSCVCLALIVVYYQWPFAYWWPWLIPAFCLVVFLRLVVWSVNVQLEINHTAQLIGINEDELKIAEGHYTHRFDGSDFLPAHHGYAADLDLFGRASVYQFIQRTESSPGQTTLAKWLLQPARPQEVLQRQAAVQALAPLVHWRQRLQATGQLNPLSARSEGQLLQWAKEPNNGFENTNWRWIRWVGPLVSIGIFTAYLLDYIPGWWFNLYLLIFLLLTGYISKRATPTWKSLGKMAAEINTLSALLQCIEEMPTGSSEKLHELSAQLRHNGDHASKNIAALNAILKRFDYRLNPLVFVPLNLLLFWDLQQMLAFGQWKKRHAPNTTAWLQVLGEVEALASLATLSFNHAGWCFPEVRVSQGHFEATQLGHPLLAASKRVVSDFSCKGQPAVTIITGSNMAGKSTFLRSVGLLLVLGQAGAPVCAATASIGSMQLLTSMRIADNLEESTSTFYAELKKLQTIIEAVKKGEPVFLLLDEILRGTNSLDRHTGSAALIKQLIRQKATGIVATHDVALADLQAGYPDAIKNYHFDVRVSGEELYFDYLLKPGICQSLNASILMKKIGIELEG